MSCPVHSVHTIKGLSGVKQDGLPRRLDEMRQPFFGPFSRKAKAMRDALTEKAIEQVRSVRLSRFAAPAAAGTIRNSGGEVKDYLGEIQRTVGPRFVRDGFQRGQKSQSVKQDEDTVVDQWQREVGRWLESPQAGREIRQITETVRQDITKIIQQGIEDGEGTEQIARRLEQNMDDINRQRGRVIARTEGVTASNRASSFGAEKASIQLRKTWVAVSDARTRESHRVVNGQTVPKSEPYVWTSPTSGRVQADYPADFSLPAAERIQCRCVETYQPA